MEEITLLGMSCQAFTIELHINVPAVPSFLLSESVSGDAPVPQM